MNNFHEDDLLDLAKEKNQIEVNIQLARKAAHRLSLNDRWLATLGVWMVSKGEKLQARYTASLQVNQLGFPQGKTKKARA
ncbi:MAG: hypothetical protein IH589_05405 [Anaerolineales bacterium]|nr:hypothetical protein [Anaerolineales bacterium]